MRDNVVYGCFTAAMLQVLILLLPRPALGAPPAPWVAVRRDTNQAGTYVEVQVAQFATASAAISFEQRRQLALHASRRPWGAHESLDTDAVCIAEIDDTDRALLGRPAVEWDLRVATRAPGNEPCRQPDGPGPLNTRRALGCLRCLATARALPGWPGMRERLGLIMTTDARERGARRATLRVHLKAATCRGDDECADGQRCTLGACVARAVVSIRRDVGPMSVGTVTGSHRPLPRAPRVASSVTPRVDRRSAPVRAAARARAVAAARAATR